MADQNVAALLAALTGGAQQQRGAPQLPQGFAGLTSALSAATGQQPPQSVNSPPTGFSLPQPTASGSLDLSKIKPTASGRVSLDDALAKVKAKAAEMGVHRDTSGGGPPRYDDPRGRYGRRSRSRSRSPPTRRGPDPYRDAYSTFRDERRGRGAGGDYGRDRDRSFSPPPRRGGSSAYSPPPRGGAGGPGGERYGGHRMRSPPPDMEQINIDASLVGLIIGRGGENLRRVEAETGARVQFMTNGHDRDSGGERVCNIQGTRPQIAAARRAIDQIIAENEKSGGSGPPPRKPAVPGGYGAPMMNQGSGPAGPGAPNLRDGGSFSKSREESTQIFVPDRTVGLIIGRGGETIRDIQDKSGCHVNIVGEAKSQNGQRPVNLIGSAQASEYAKRLIMEIVESDTNGGPPGPPVRAPPSQHYGGSADGARLSETIRVPIDAVGMIIGKGGETIKEMQNSTGCRINVSSQFNPNDQEREISLAGNREAIARARAAIDEKVEASLNKSRPRGGGAGGYDNSNAWGAGSGAQQQQQYQQPQQPQQQQQQQNPTSATPAQQTEDPYAPYGGYQNYCAMYYAAMLQQQQAAVAAAAAGQQNSGSGGGPPGV